MASVVESLIGACYLQFGLERTAEAPLAAFAPQVESPPSTCSTSSRPCRSSSPGEGRRVALRGHGESGPPHDKTLPGQARVDGEVVGTGDGASKKAAEQAAAAEALGD